MPTPVLKRQIQVLAKVETTPGSYEALTSAHSMGRISADSEVEYNFPMEPRDIARGTLSNLGELAGEKSFGFRIRSEINSADTVTDALENKAMLEACGITVQDAKAVPVGAIAGTFTRGETIEDESANTGRLLVQAAGAAGRLLYDAISGTLVSGDAITGAASGASADASGPGANAGHILKPVSDNQKTISIGFERDGLKWQGTGVMGNLIGTFETSKKGMLEFALQGPRHDKLDEALTTGVTYQTEQPPILQGADLAINSVAVVARSITFDNQATVVLRPDMNKANTGLISAYISQRDPQMVVSFEDLPEATLDLEGLWTEGTKVPIKFNIGTAEGKIIYVFGDLAQVTGITQGDQDGISTIDVTLKLTGAANKTDDEFEIVYA
jgi:hypothetical protein